MPEIIGSGYRCHRNNKSPGKLTLSSTIPSILLHLRGAGLARTAVWYFQQPTEVRVGSPNPQIVGARLQVLRGHLATSLLRLVMARSLSDRRCHSSPVGSGTSD